MHNREWPARDTIRFMQLCTPGMGVNLWGESPLYENQECPCLDATRSTSRRQGRFREGWSEGSRMAYVRTDEQKSHDKAQSPGELARHNKAQRFKETG